jgi:glycerol-3-phosphate acyltransferase PlsX
MNIIVDALGGDENSSEVVKACVKGSKDFDVDITIVGDELSIKKELKKYGDTSRIKVVNATEKIDNYDEPVTAIKTKKDSSMVKGFDMLKRGEGDGFISAGNTGALLIGATLIIGRIKGIDRPALSPFIPTDKGVSMLLDVGASTNCRCINIYQYAFMATSYLKHVMGVENPKAALLNIGLEEGKGDKLRKEAYEYLKESPINFTGNIEARDIPTADVDIILTDGFSGNIVLKLYEGVAKYFTSILKNMFTKNIFTKLSALMVKGSIKDFKGKMDYTTYGGAPFLGVKKPVFKTHGSSKWKEFYYTIKNLKLYIENNVIDEIKTSISETGGNFSENV